MEDYNRTGGSKMTIGGIIRGIGKSLRPRQEEKDVVITLDFPVLFEITDAEEDTGFNGQIDWEYDTEMVRKMIDEKIQEFINQNRNEF